MIHDEIVTFEVAMLAKEKGFQLDCIGYYDFAGEFHFNYESAISNKEMTFCHNKYNNIWHRGLTDAPTQSLLQRWLREEKGVIIVLEYSDNTEDWRPFWSWIVYDKLGFTIEIGDNKDTYEFALEDALKYALEYLM